MAKHEPPPEEGEASVFATRLSAGADESDVFQTELADMDDILGLPPSVRASVEPEPVVRAPKFQTLKPEPVILRHQLPAAFATELDAGVAEVAREKPGPIAPTVPSAPASPRVDSVSVRQQSQLRRRSAPSEPALVRLRVGFLAGLTLGAGLLLAFSEAPPPEPSATSAHEALARRSMSAAGAVAPQARLARAPTASESKVPSLSSSATAMGTASPRVAAPLPAPIPKSMGNLKTSPIDPARQRLRTAVDHLRGGRVTRASDAYRALADAAPGDIALRKAAEILQRQAAQSSTGSTEAVNDSATQQKGKAP